MLKGFRKTYEEKQRIYISIYDKKQNKKNKKLVKKIKRNN